jgi:cyclic pyranopterin monophosphate synthase
MAENEEAGGLSHLDESGEAKMVDVGGKDATARTARAEAVVVMRTKTVEMVTSGSVPKGDVFSTARIAGINAAKGTAGLIPLCHPLRLDSVSVDFEVTDDGRGIRIEAEARATDRTGVEMEALVAASVAALTVYDMCKAAERGIEVRSVRLLSKSGGRSGTWRREG